MVVKLITVSASLIGQITWLPLTIINMEYEIMKYVLCYEIHCLYKRKSRTFGGPLFVLITERICCGIVSTTLCNITTLFPSRVALIFGQDFVLMTGELNHFLSLFQHIPKIFIGGNIKTLWWPIHVWKWLLMLPDTHVTPDYNTTIFWLKSKWQLFLGQTVYI